MAKFSDYVKDDQLDKELADLDGGGSNAEPVQDSEIPERFRGKSPAEIARAYAELEKMNSRQAQDLGKMRKTVDDMIALELQKAGGGQDAPSTKPVTTDELWDNPDDAISRVVDKKVSSRVEELERELLNERVARAKGEFEKSFPDWQSDVQDPAFINWVKESPYRTRLAMDADRGDFGAAETLFGTYRDLKKARESEQRKEEAKRKVKEVALESSGAGASEPTEKVSRSALMEKRIAAKRGDRAAARWLESNAAAIRAAYEESRIVD